MSCNNNRICRDKYANYGSYLRSRGYDKEICNLILAIKEGTICFGMMHSQNGKTNITGWVYAGTRNNICGTYPGGLISPTTSLQITTQTNSWPSSITAEHIINGTLFTGFTGNTITIDTSVTAVRNSHAFWLGEDYY